MSIYASYYHPFEHMVVCQDVLHTNVLFTGTAKSPFLTPRISTATGPIYIFYALHIYDFTYQI